MRSIAELLDEIDKNRLDCSYEVDQWVAGQLAGLRSDVIKFQRDDAYQRYLRRYIAEDYSPGDHGGQPRCDCGNDCPVLDGKLPSMVQRATDPGRAQEEWAIRHTGTPYALLSADDEYRDELAGLYTSLNRLVAATRRDTIPKSEQETDEQAADGDKAEVTV